MRISFERAIGEMSHVKQEILSMKLRNFVFATAAASFVAAPVVAQASFDRANAPVEGERLEGENGILIAALAAAAIIAGIIVIADDDDDPVSP